MAIQQNMMLTILELAVRNHPGVMSHVCGLLSRRGFNMEGIVCLPIQNSTCSRIWLLVNETQHLEQIMKQLQKLQDVHNVHKRSVESRTFHRLQTLIEKKAI